MGNRTVLVLKDSDWNDGVSYSRNNKIIDYIQPNDLGIYLHWNGSPEQVQEILDKTKELMADRIGDSFYTKARLLGVINDLIPGNLSVGLGLAAELDYANGDNGYYVINCEDISIIHHVTPEWIGD